MAVLSEKEFLMLNDIVKDVHASKSLEELGQNLLHLLRKLIPFSSAVFTVLDPENPLYVDPVKSVCVDASLDSLRAYNEYVSMDFTNPAFSYPKSSSFRDSDIITEAEKGNTGFYNKWMKDRGLEYSGGIVVKTPKGNMASVTIYRSRFNGPFTEREMMILDMLIGHMEDITARFLDPEKQEAVFSMDYDKDLRYGSLSNREKEIFHCLMKRYSNEEIGDELCISISTVKKHIHNIFTKFDVNSRRQLVSLFLPRK